MRYLRRQTLNRRAPYDNRLYIDTTDSIVMGTSNNLMLPSGTTAERPVTPVNGMIRYNTTLNEVEMYQSSKWRSLKFKEASPIIQQNLGAGDANSVYFGPLNAEYNPTNISSNVPLSGGQSVGQFGGQNIFVVVENVIQLYNTNYLIEQNPTLGGATYTGSPSATAALGATTINFNTALPVTGSSGNGTVATLTFATQPAAPFSVGSTITVTGMTPTAYNGVQVVVSSTTSSVSFNSTATGSMVFPGEIVSSQAIYPATNLANAVVTGSPGLQANTRVVSYSIDTETNALLSIVIDKPLTAAINAGTSLTLTDPSEAVSGYYIKFNSPPPYGKIVTAIIGFDQ